MRDPLFPERGIDYWICDNPACPLDGSVISNFLLD